VVIRRTPAAFLVLLGSLLYAPASLSAQRPASERDLITEASVRAHLEFLASDALNGRGSGTRDEWIAATYIASQVRRWGLEPLGDNGGFVQQVDIERSEASAPPVLTFGTSRLTHGSEMVVQSLMSARVAGPLQKLLAGTAVRPGSVVLFPSTSPPSASAAAGASLVLMARQPQMDAFWTSTGAAMPRLPAALKGATAPPRRPSVVVLTQAAFDSVAALADGTQVTLAADVKPPAVSHTWNVVARLSGRDRRSAADAILLTAHLDHLGNRPPRNASSAADTIFNGADDDASGCVAVLELAEALSTGRRPKRTVIFTWFGSEESGGYGAAHFLDHPPVPLDRIVANLEFEMIGRPDSAVAPHTLWLTGYERSDLGPRLASRGARIVQDPHPAENFFMRSDNIQLAMRGVVAQTVSSFGLHHEYHQPNDEVSFVDFAHMTDSIRSMLEPVRWLANSSFRPVWLPGKKP
jgi:hypothetical protein